MSREWKPGDVALIKWSRRPEGAVYIRTNHAILGDIWWGADGWIGNAFPQEIRPLVVIDPEDREQVERLVDALRALTSANEGGFVLRMQAALRSLVEPPKPDEPQGLGAVVEAKDGRKWVRSGHSHTNPNWRVSGGDAWFTYDAITAVRVLSEGVRDA